MGRAVPGMPTPVDEAAADRRLSDLEKSVAAAASSYPTAACVPVRITARATAITTTNLVATAIPGRYQINAYLQSTTAIAAGTATITFGFTDDIGATTDATLSVLLTGTNRAQLTRSIRSAAAVITYALGLAGVVGTPAVNLDIELLRLP